ncbi:MAG: hypothetical protein L0Y66_01495 [Myxococcaceae bacterium]|nr:hypothetical protein [Myxococcaceae bacterium]MCI0672558.1 hypothetical protein [Myxococcaceae bacterium]
MDAKKLFHVLVVGGALLGVAAVGCGGGSSPEDNNPGGGQGLSGDGGTHADGGDVGGGTEGW